MNVLGSSEQLFKRACQSLPGGVPGFHRLFSSANPLFMVRGRGAWLYDADDRAFLDFVLGKGPVILGHGHEVVTEAVIRAIRDAPMLGLMSPLAVEAAETLLELFPAGSRLRFHKSGSEGCAAAVRMARAHTGRAKIVSSGYHGWHDWCSPNAPGARGEGDFHEFAYDLCRLATLLKQHGDEVAAVIVEPQPGFLELGFYTTAADLARRAGALFILDEVKSGCRVPAFTVASSLPSAPDLVILSKAISNGFCVSCTVGPESLMTLSDRLHVGGTFDFESGPLAAIAPTIRLLRDGNVPAVLCARAAALAKHLNSVFQSRDTGARAFATGAGFRIGFLCPQQEAAFYENIWQRGILLYPFDNQFLSSAHADQDLEHLVEIVDQTLCALATTPQSSWSDAAGLLLNGFPNRKGFLAQAPGPEGIPVRAHVPELQT